MNVLRVRNLSFGYRRKEVLREISFEVKRKELVAILGPNGAGKSTLLKCLAGILKCEGVEILGKPISAYTREELARVIGYVPQKFYPGMMRVFDVVLLGRRPYMRLRPSREDIEMVESLLERLGLSHLALENASNLSGGELQRVNIARALAQNPEILLLDEPTSNLDPKNQLEVMQIVEDFVRVGKTAIMVVHDINLALRFATRFIFMKDGKIVKDGGKETLKPETFGVVYHVDGSVENVSGFPVFVLKRSRS